MLSENPLVTRIYPIVILSIYWDSTVFFVHALTHEQIYSSSNPSRHFPRIFKFPETHIA